MEKITNMTAGELFDIAQSQICLHGNKAVFVRTDEQEQLVFWSGDKAIFECVNYDEKELSVCSLETIANALEGGNMNELVLCSSNEAQKRGFQIGFKSEGQFIEVLNSLELAATTI